MAGRFNYSRFFLSVLWHRIADFIIQLQGPFHIPDDILCLEFHDPDQCRPYRWVCLPHDRRLQTFKKFGRIGKKHGPEKTGFSMMEGKLI
jgi:hypothetical protein